MSASDTLRASWRSQGGIYRESRLAGLGVAHGVTTRILGNMKESERRLQTLAGAGLGRARPLLLKQVHGAAVAEAGAGGDPVPEADGWIAREPGLVSCVYVADCLPIFVWGPGGSAVGVFHAGWRGLDAGMGKAAARAFRRFGLGPESLSAAVGPHIGPCCYEVGPEAARRFHSQAFGRGRDASESPEKRLLDLGKEARLQLLEAGVPPGAVDVLDACTACRPEEFFSYRRDKQDLRMMAFIAARAAP